MIFSIVLVTVYSVIVCRKMRSQLKLLDNMHKEKGAIWWQAVSVMITFLFAMCQYVIMFSILEYDYASHFVRILLPSLDQLLVKTIAPFLMMLSHNAVFTQHENLSSMQCDSSVTNTTQVFLDVVRLRETEYSDITPNTNPLFRSGTALANHESKKLTTDSSMKFHPSIPHLSS